MNHGKRLALEAYYYSTLPIRKLDEWRRTALGRRPVRVLFYHRVADTNPTPWTISCAAFAKQLEWIRRHFRIVSLADAQAAIASGSNCERLASITFDDGYADNCAFAIPLLLRLGVPFTYFVTTSNVINQIPFDHDLDLGLSLRPNNIDEIRSMARAGVDIGAHTRTHRDLGKLDSVDILRDEIYGSRIDLQQMTDSEIPYFAFPFGQRDNLSTLALRVAFEAGFAGVCSAFGGVNPPGGDPFHLQRLHGDPDFARLRNWMTIDPRLKLLTPPFQNGDYREPLPSSTFSRIAATNSADAGVAVDG
jgi:peptidoglycan/xylan/chitin deacetylase (PgdA/CDA1 family)